MAEQSDFQEKVTKSPAPTPNAPAAVTRDGTMAAMGREALKDLRQAFMHVFFDCPEGAAELGTPLNPLPSEIRNSNRADQHPYGHQLPATAAHISPAPTAGDIAHDRDTRPQGSVYGPETSRSSPTAGEIAHDRDGQVLQQEGKWEEKIRQEREGGNADKDGYDRPQERIKPEEEREKQREQERGDRGR